MSDTIVSESQQPAQPAGGSEIPPFRYTAALADEIEQRWQAHWESQGTFRTPNPGDEGFDASKPKYYCLDMFPYPSGTGLHVGHPEGYTATDILCRYKRHTGCNVLHPMGWDAFGLPAEQYAIETGIHPSKTTKTAIDTFRRQLKRFGFSYDWSREFATIDEDYYRWTQWIWLKAYDAWYDPAANRARPISELLQDLENGHAYVGPSGEIVQPATEGRTEAFTGEPVGLRKFHELEPDERRRFIDDQRLAYLDEQTVNWCPKLGTALANEEVKDGKSERGSFPVYRRPLRQWMFRITKFAERLLFDLDFLKWPNSTVTQQKEWIGRSEGAEFDFLLDDDSGEAIRVYTTRPDTVFGATYMVLAPEHPLVEAFLANPRPETDVDAVRAYVEKAVNRSEVDRMTESKDKTGVFSGVYAINPASEKRIGVWIADYVLMGYGHGAIMAVPGQDQRDWDFASAFDLPIIRTVQPPDDFDGDAYVGEGAAINSGLLDGLQIDEAKDRIIEWMEEKSIGRRMVNYKLRDWLFSRQRYWGEPVPVVFDADGNHHPVDEANLPVILPPLEDYTPEESDVPRPLLAKATQWVNTTAGAAGVSADLLPPDTPVTREANTMPGWAGSCWYYLRFCDPKNDDRFISRDIERYWMFSRRDGKATGDHEHFDIDSHHLGGVDQYIGGAEHAVLHLLYARFWHKLLYDLGEVSTPEPIGRLFHQGLITSHAYQREDRSLVPIDQVDEQGQGDEATYIERATGKPVARIVAKMSKSLKNVVNPDDIIADFGADTFRLYEMYMGPLEASKPWNTRDINGLFRFLQRAWRLCISEDSGQVMLADAAADDIEKALHRTIAKVAKDIEALAMNTAIAALIEFVNEATKSAGDRPALTGDQMERFVVTLSPLAPHVAEEIWSKLGHEDCLAYESWPSVDESWLQEDLIKLPVQVNGRVRSTIVVPADADDSAVQAAAMADENVASHLVGKTVRKVVIVSGKIVNIVAN